MPKNQKGFAPIILIIAIVLIAGITGFFYLQKNLNKQSSNQNIQQATSPNLACKDYDQFLKFVVANIDQSFSRASGDGRERAPDYLKWKRSSGELFIGYPAIRSEKLSYENRDGRKYDVSKIINPIQSASAALEKNIPLEIASLGLTVDPLNTTSLMTFGLGAERMNNPYAEYVQIFGFKKGNDLYSTVLNASFTAQAFGFRSVEIMCANRIDLYDKVYDALNFREDQSISNKYGHDYIDIFEVSPDKKVFGAWGSDNHIDIANYYYYEGNSIKEVATGSFFVHCSDLEKQKIGKGMNCVNPAENYLNRKVNY